MDTGRDGAQGIVALLPFFVTGALSLSVLRAMRGRGLDVTIASHESFAHGYTTDAVEDFHTDNLVLDLSATWGADYASALNAAIERRRIGLVLQIGAARAYAVLPYLTQRHPGLRIVDTLYNEVGHTVNHFLYETCFDGVIVESQHMRGFVQRCSAKADPNIVLVESGIDLDHFAPLPTRPPENGFVLGYIGRFSREKNPMGFVELAERLAPGFPSLSFSMFGQGGMAEEIKGRIAASSLGDRIRLEDYVPDVRAALSRVDAIVVPSRFDGRPNIIMEANACGRPVLAAPVGGIPELIEDGRNGYLVAPEDMTRLIKILRAWTTSPKTFAALSVSSRATAVARFDRRRMLDDYEAALRGFFAK